jgi:hypothetical protein
MRIRGICRATLVVALGVIPRLPAQAWNRTGHEVIAYIAYSNLDPKTRLRLDALLREHPDYPRWVQGVSGGERSRAAFLAASFWPDTIRGDPRFFDDEALPTPATIGFPDMGRHQLWHYIDIPFSTDGTPFEETPRTPNVLTQITSFRKSISDPTISPSVRAYQLAWLIHLVGDVHQPLHCAVRFTRAQRDQITNHFIGDQGGNLIVLDNGQTLHAYWDGLLGAAVDQVSVATLARDVRIPVKMGKKRVEMNEREWVAESFQIAKTFVYGFDGAGTQEDPARLRNVYHTEATRIARMQAALAGYRLAAVLKSSLGT